MAAGRIFDDCPVGSEVSPQDRDGSFFCGFLHREDHLIPFQSIVVKVSEISLKKIVSLKILQIFAECFSRDSHHIQMQHIFQVKFHHRHASGKPEGFRQMFAAGINVSEMGYLMVDLVEQLWFQVHSQFSGDRRKMDRGICGTADRTVNDNGVLKCFSGQNIADRNPFPDQCKDLPPCFSRICKYIPHGRRHQRRSGKGKPQRLRHTLHCAGRTQKRTGSAGRTSGQLIIPDLLSADRIFTLLPQGNIPCHKGSRHIRSRTHAAAGNKDRRQVKTRGSLQLGRDRFVTGGRQDHPVPWIDGTVNLDHVTDRLPGRQNIVHSVMSLGTSVTDVRRVVLSRKSSFFKDSVFCLLHQTGKMGASGMAVAEYILQQDLRLCHILFVPS